MRSIKELFQKREEVAAPGEKLVRINSVSSQGGDHQLHPGIKIEVELGFIIEVDSGWAFVASHLFLASEQAIAESGWGNSSTW